MRMQAPTAPKIKVPRLRKPPSLPTGPRMFRPVPLDQQAIHEGPGEPPPTFLTPRTSKTEWYVYWGLATIFDNPKDPRQAPFLGGYPDWTYQLALDDAGAIVDFIVNNPGKSQQSIALRIVTEYWHLYTTNGKHASDEMQKEALSAYFTVIDLYDFDFIHDPTGAATIVTLKNVLGMIERPNPLWLGTAIRGSRIDRIGVG